MTFRFGKKSLERLTGVHPDLVKVAMRAIEISTVDFMIGEGVRTIGDQRRYVRIGASKTMRSRHLPASNKCNLGCAIDLWALNDIDNDGDLDINWVNKHYLPIAEAMKQAAKELNIKIEWGVDLWGWDAPHFQLPWKEYP
jgi:peptidoglycan L-alanyl-D-glutamate endopeptidase CwlK